MTKPELKPCPFCGSAGELYEREFTDEYANYGNACVDCTECGIGMAWKADKSAAIAAWNTRA